MPSNAKFLKRQLKKVILDEKTPTQHKLRAIHLFGFLDGQFPKPDQTREDPRSGPESRTITTMPEPMEDISDLLQELDGKANSSGTV